jgi:hypothetical protein
VRADARITEIALLFEPPGPATTGECYAQDKLLAGLGVGWYLLSRPPVAPQFALAYSSRLSVAGQAYSPDALRAEHGSATGGAMPAFARVRRRFAPPCAAVDARKALRRKARLAFGAPVSVRRFACTETGALVSDRITRARRGMAGLRPARALVGARSAWALAAQLDRGWSAWRSPGNGGA